LFAAAAVAAGFESTVFLGGAFVVAAFFGGSGISSVIGGVGSGNLCRGESRRRQAGGRRRGVPPVGERRV
jgi:hypothetical protein